MCPSPGTRSQRHTRTSPRSTAHRLRVAPARRPPRACGHGHRQGHGHRHGHDCDGLGSAEMGPEERRASPDSREKPWAQERPAKNLPFGLGVGGGSGGKKSPAVPAPLPCGAIRGLSLWPLASPPPHASALVPQASPPTGQGAASPQHTQEVRPAGSWGELAPHCSFCFADFERALKVGRLL